ncbi:MAG: MFS transporter [Chloroflexi bacterium]|nr:MFS transporter [Chloroflexota bacterium]
MRQRAAWWIERALVGRVPDDVGFNVRVELWASVAYGVFHAACLGFMPVVLRREGASAEALALYVAFTYIGLVIAPLSMVALRHISPMRLSVWCWGLGRGVLLLAFAFSGAPWLLFLTAVMWIMESIPSPAYSRIMEQGYPREYRGRAMAGIRVGMALTVLALTPLAGWALDAIGHRWLFPVAAVFGVASVLIFARMRLSELPGEPQARPSLAALLPILRHNRAFRWFLIALTMYGLGGVMPVALYPIVQVNRLGLSYTEIGALGLVQSLFWLAGFFLWGRALDRHGPLPVLIVSVALAACVPFTYLWAGSAWALLPAFIAQGLLQGGFELGVTNVTIALAERGRVLEYAALQTLVIGLRGLAAPLIGTLLLQAGVDAAWLFGGATVVMLLSIPMFLAARSPAPGRRTP